MTRIRAVVALVLVPMAVLLWGPAPQVARAEDPAPKIMLVLDASGSMADPDPSGDTKMAAAKKALITSLDSLPPEAEVGLRVYGATGGGAGGSCQDSQIAHPVSALDKAGLTSVINGFQPTGDTPIAYSLGEAAKDLGDSGKRHIILVSDGEETCDPDPCSKVQQIRNSGIDVQIDTVGFGVNDAARAQLACIAEAGGGTYYDAKDKDSLTSSLERLNTRTARPYTVSGTPVQGTESADTAPELTTGQYTDVSTASTSGETTRHYRIRRTSPNSTIRVSAVARMPAAADLFDALDRGSWSYKLTTPAGTKCGSASASNHDSGGIGVVTAATVDALSMDPSVTAPDKEKQECAEAEELVYSIERGAGTGGGTPIELRVIEEPLPDNVTELPAGIAEVPEDNSEQLTSPASGTPQAVVGGASFNDAQEVPAGTYTTELVPGETLFFKTRIGYGQSALFSQDGLELGPVAIEKAGLRDFAEVVSNVYGPDFSQMDSDEFMAVTMYQVSRSDGVEAEPPTINQVPEVRYRNRWDSPRMYYNNSIGFSMDGYYYYAVGLGEKKFLAGQPANINFSIAVTGQAGGEPSSSVRPSQDSDNPGDPSSGTGTSSRWPLYAAGIGLVVLGAGGITFALLRRRR